jgi:adenylate kinase family enzyme
MGERTGLPVVHLDTLYWRPGWRETPRDEWAARVEELISGDAWVIDGNYSRTLDRRLAACDTVVFLDMPRALCLWRVFKRRLMFRNRARPDMNEGCREQLTWEFLRWVWTYPRERRPRVLEKLRGLGPGKRFFHLRSTREAEEFLKGLRKFV